MKINNYQNLEQFTLPQKTINYRKYFALLISHWKWFVIAIIFTSIGIWLYYKYTHPVYEVSASILIEEQQNQNPLITAADKQPNVFQGFSLFNGNQNIENQIQILKSWSLIYNTLEHFDFEVTYSERGFFRTTELYHDLPFEIEFDDRHSQLIDTNFDLKFLSDNKVRIKTKSRKAIRYDYLRKTELSEPHAVNNSRTFDINEQIKSADYSFRIIPISSLPLQGRYRINFNSLNELTNKYLEKLTVYQVSLKSSILKLKTTCENTEKGIAFLDMLMRVYQEHNLKKKNTIATKTIFFITSQLSEVRDSLKASQKIRERFQSNNQLLDVGYQSQQLLDQLVKLEDQKNLLETQHQYYKYLENYLLQNGDLESLVAPSTVGIDAPLLVNLLRDLNQLNIELSTLSATVHDPEYPRMRQLRIQMETTKRTLLENSRSIMHQSELTLQDISKRTDFLRKQTRSLPAVERDYVNIERSYQLNNNNYNFLLQKLSEAQIAKASNTPDNEVIDPARIIGDKPVKPNNIKTGIAALLLGIFFPSTLIITRNALDNKVRTLDDLKLLTDSPVLGQIPHDEQVLPSQIPLLEHPNSPLGESYRALRTKLKFIQNGNEHNVIAVTSTTAGEGKTFTALNLAASFALLGKKTVFLDLDLRNSRIGKKMGYESNRGASNYILNEMSINDITFNTPHPYLHIIPAGSIPPNPGEMLADIQLVELTALLKQEYETIIIDSSPLLVADVFQFSNLWDTLLFVTRQGITLKPAAKSALQEISSQNTNRLGLLLNDISINNQFDRYNNHSYGYGYENNYKKKISKELKPRRRSRKTEV